MTTQQPLHQPKIDRYIHIEPHLIAGTKVGVTRYFPDGRCSRKLYTLNSHDEARINQLNRQLTYSVYLTNEEMEVVARWAK